MIIPVILSGGSGTRLWPLSTAERPKQFIPLLGEKTLFQLALERLNGIPDMADPIIICGQQHEGLVDQQLEEHSSSALQIVLEPMGKSTAPAIAIASLIAQSIDQNAILLVLSADHIILDVPAFHEAVQKAKAYAQTGSMICFGIVPSYPETGYGYIESGISIGEQGGYQIARFVEKPNVELAKEYVASGRFAWNSGIFMFQAKRYLGELNTFAPDIFQASLNTLEASTVGKRKVFLNPDVFATCRSDSIDYAVMEHTKNAVVIPVDMGWSDVGSWDAVWNCDEKNAEGNVLRGNIVTHEVEDSYIHTKHRPVVALGLKDVVIIETEHAVLVMGKDQGQNLKKALEKVK